MDRKVTVLWLRVLYNNMKYVIRFCTARSVRRSSVSLRSCRNSIHVNDPWLLLSSVRDVLRPVPLVDTPGSLEIPLRCSSDSSLACVSALERDSPHYIFHSEPLFPFNLNRLHIKTRSAFTRRLRILQDCWTNETINIWTHKPIDLCIHSHTHSRLCNKDRSYMF